MEVRGKLVEVAAFLDRVRRADGSEDFRMEAFRRALTVLGTDSATKARDVLVVFSDPTTEPASVAHTKAACGAWPGQAKAETA